MDLLANQKPQVLQDPEEQRLQLEPLAVSEPFFVPQPKVDNIL